MLHEVQIPPIFNGFSLDPLCRRLDAIIKATQADFGNLQLIDPASGGLVIAAQRGFKQEFLEFFRCVKDESSACGVAMKQSRPIVVTDVTEDPIFSRAGNRETLEVLLSARVRAVHSTPLVSTSGELIGMISAHYRRPLRPSEEMILRHDLMAQNLTSVDEHFWPSNGDRRETNGKFMGPEYGLCPRRRCDFVIHTDVCRNSKIMPDATCPACGSFLIFFCLECFAPIKSSGPQCPQCGASLKAL